MKKKHLILLLILIIMVVAAIIAFGKPLDAAKAHEALIKKYGSVNSLAIDFAEGNGGNVKGSIKAKRGNKYVLELGDRLITSNGKKLWNYNRADKNVVLSDYKDVENSSSIENFFFTFLYNYKPTSLTEEKNQWGKGSRYKLTLAPERLSATIDDVSEISVYLDNSKKNIIGLSLNTAGSLQTWRFISLKTNPKLNDSMFNFKTPKNVQVIDLQD